MKCVLVVDDMAIFRDPIAASLRLAGYETLCAPDGKEALALVRARMPHLILLDLAMPVMDGLQVLRLLRGDPVWAKIPVIVLSAISDRSRVLESARLGVRDYLLKSRFSMRELLERVKRQLDVQPPAPSQAAPSKAAPGSADEQAQSGQAAQAQPTASPAPAAQQAPAAPAPPAAPEAAAVPIPRLLARESSLQRAENAMQAKALSGVVAQVISLTASPRGDLSQLATLIGRDPMLSARVLQAANSAAYVSSRGVVSTIPEAVRHIGCATIRNIATALGVFSAMPETGADGFNPIRCWQHSFAVANLCEQLAAAADPDQAPLAYLVGLCHDLGEILFHTQFQKEYEQVLRLRQQTGQPQADLERRMLGISQGELVQTILRCIGLPESIREPIEEFHGLTRRSTTLPLTRILRMAEPYANGVLLASGENAAVMPLTRRECLAAARQDDPPVPDAMIFRSEIFGLTGALARLSRADEAALIKPIFAATPERFWLARHPLLSGFDPLAAALQALGEAEIFNRLPQNPAELAGRKLVVAAPTAGADGFTADDLSKLALPPQRLLWLIGRSADSDGGSVRPVQWPIPLSALARFASADCPDGAHREAA